MAIKTGYEMPVGSQQTIPYAALKADGVSAFDLTGYTLRFSFSRTRPAAGVYVFQKDSAGLGGVVITNLVGGLANIQMNTPDTLNLGAGLFYADATPGSGPAAAPQPGGPHSRPRRLGPRPPLRLPGRVERSHVQPRGEQGESGIDFADLRALADPTQGGLDLLRLAIETRKDQMESQRWRSAAATRSPTTAGTRRAASSRRSASPTASTPSRSGSGCSSRTCSSSTRRRSTSRRR
jgi:hypothetical protein